MRGARFPEPDAAVPGLTEPRPPTHRNGSSSITQGRSISVVVSPAASTVPLNEVAQVQSVAARSIAAARSGGPSVQLGDSRRRRIVARRRRPGGRVSGTRRSRSRAAARSTVTQRETACRAEALVTITDSLESRDERGRGQRRGACRATPSNGPPGSCGAVASMPSATLSWSTAAIAISYLRRAIVPCSCAIWCGYT